MRQSLPRPTLPVLICGFSALQLRQRTRRTLQGLGLGRAQALPEDRLRPPDSALCTKAEALAEAAYEPHLLGHCYRTWAFALAVAQHDGLKPDPEALYVAALLHDLGLTERFAGTTPFELRGADAAHRLCLPDETRAQIVHEAIALHTSLGAALGSAVVRLLQSGSGGDLVGLDMELIHPATRTAIRARWPTETGFVGHVCTRLKSETRPHPHSPGAGLLRVGFAGRIAAHHRTIGG